MMCLTPSFLQNVSTSLFLKWEPPLDMKDLGTAYSRKIRLSDPIVDFPEPVVLSFVPQTKLEYVSMYSPTVLKPPFLGGSER